MDLVILHLFQFASAVSLYNLYVSAFRNTRYEVQNFQLFWFQFVSKLFETSEILDTDIFTIVSVGLLLCILYMFQCFETPEMGLRHFRLFQFDSVSSIYNLNISGFRNTRHGIQNVHLFCFSLLQNVSKQVKVLTLSFSPVSICLSQFTI